MPNPILEQATRLTSDPQLQFQNNANFQLAKNLFKTVQSSSNQQATLQNLMMQNPQIQQIVDLTRGKNLRSMFYTLARQEGIDPDLFIQQLKS